MFHVDKEAKKIRPEVYPEIHAWTMDNVPGKNYADKNHALACFYKRHYGKPPIVTISQDVIEEVNKVIKEMRL